MFGTLIHVIGLSVWITECSSLRTTASTLSLKETVYGEDLRLPCKFSNTTKKVKWYKDDKPLKNSAHKRISNRKKGRVLKIKKIVQADAGIYSCIDVDGDKVIVRYNISVKVADGLVRAKPSFKYADDILKQLNSVKPAGNDFTLSCQAVGALPIRYKWFKDGARLLTRRLDSSFVTDKAELKLLGLVKSDSANYTCLAENQYGQISSHMILHVKERIRASPYIEKATMKNQTRYVGDNVSIVCYELITGTIPDFRWLKWKGILNVTLLEKYVKQEAGVGAVDEEIARVIHADYYHPTKKDSLRANERSVVRGVEVTLSNVTKEDTGYYTCIATNHIGADYASMYLDVKDREDESKAVIPTEDDRLTTNGTMQIVIAVLGVLVFMSLCILVWLFVTWKLKGRRDLARNDMGLANFDKKLNIVMEKRIQSNGSLLAPLLSVGSGRMNSESTGYFDDAIPIPFDPDWEIDRSCLQISDTLGEGAFGVVVKAVAVGLDRPDINNSFVAIKMLKADATDYELMDLLSEMETMKQIGRHTNIISFLGCCTERKPVYVVVEYAPHGNLRQYLRSKRPPASECDQRMEPLLSIKDMVSFALQISKGMVYLGTQKCIHRDLAARNILVAEDCVMKIGDFGLARSVHEMDYYRKTTDGRLPVKWLAIEALFDRVYTTQSDVWAFGVLLWEIFTLGGSPYPGIPIERLFDLLKSGFRMERPQICPLETYETMVKCWYENPSHRPSFVDLVNEIGSFLEMLTSEDYLEVLGGSIASINSSHNEDDDISEGQSYSDSSNSVFPSANEIMSVPC